MTFSYDRRYRGPIRLVILDWAGTTMDYGCYAPAVLFVEVYRRRGGEISMEEAREPMGTHKLVHIRKISRIPSVARRWKEIHSRPCAEEDVQAMFDEFVPLQLDCLADYGPFQ
jgi:phosphonoacetaldehyde hydrolase